MHCEDNTLRLIRQTDHAEAAGQLAAQWTPSVDWPGWIWRRFVQAVRRHDDGWAELEKTPALDEAGRPYTFKNLPTPQHVIGWGNGINKLAHEDPYAGLLLALHAWWLYTKVARNDEPKGEAAAQRFLEWLGQRIDELMQQLQSGDTYEREAVSPKRLDHARRLIGFFDMLSLILLGSLDVNDWPEPLPFGQRCESLRLYRPQAGELGTEPWPFSGEEVTVTMPGYDLPQQRFASAEQLGELMQQCAPVTLTFRLSNPLHYRGD